ncbi:DUF4251 domain-containing protein [Prolixibacter denitrificans]|uniref:Uncharacterized protein DUF4251 n=2 Tax=Prolixibacter denitrificans TaxID=1541063 RepID=A0A2P8C8D4_9BACT|nr:DUF4251 domain-containing protein [Prolixibacter denitrificans]PSK81224.1 uncharacterized protein DUF4251 [Prolixibacter denitrificans]
MKTKILTMVMGVLLGVGTITQAYAQNSGNGQDTMTRQEKRAMKKKQREAANMAQFEQAKQALENGDWVLEANRLYTKWGRLINVSDQTNFVSLENNTAYMQLAFNGYTGPNGLGGITLKGKPTQIKMTEDKNGNITYQMSVIGNALTADITVRLSKGNNFADAEVSAATTSARLRFAGQLVPLDQSTTYRSGMDF